MKKLKILSLALALLTFVATVTGCTFVQAQKMKNVKGTYLLTTRTNTHAVTGAVTDYVNDKGWQVYLVVTGTGTGYYVFKDNQTEQPWYKEVTLSYEYDEDNSSLVRQVHYKFLNDNNDYHFGVTKDALNYSKPPVKITDKWHTPGESWTWKKESDAIDLSYAREKLGEIVPYQTNEE